MSNTVKRSINSLMCMGLAIVLAGCGHHGISGEYISQTADEAILLQVTQSGDHNLSGSLISTDYDRSGKLRHDSAAFTGSINHNQLALKIGMGGLSGIVEGDTITLSSPATLFTPPQKLALKRAGEADYDRIVDKMKQEAPKRQAAIKQEQHQIEQKQRKIERKQRQEEENRSVGMQAKNLEYWVSSHASDRRLTDPTRQGRSSLQYGKKDLAAALRSAPESAEAKRQYKNTLVVEQWVAGDVSGVNAHIADLEEQIRNWDARIAKSSCRTRANTTSQCADEIRAERKYRAVRQTLESQIATARVQVAKLVTDMDSIVAKAKVQAGE